MSSLMERSVRDRWITRLRSGHYKQGQPNLCIVKNETGEKFYCCLGVFNDMVHTPFRINDNYPARDKTYIDYADSPVGTPTELLAWEGASNQYRLADYGTRDPERGVLIRMNDTGKSFDEIANWIEKNIATEHTAACDDEACPDHGIRSVNNGD